MLCVGWSLSYAVRVEYVTVAKIKKLIKAQTAYATLQISLIKTTKIFPWKKYER